MNQTQLSFSNNDAVRMPNSMASMPSRAGRQMPRKDYAQMHNGGRVAQTRGRSASPSFTTRHAPARQRSPLPSSSDTSQDPIEPSDSISQTSQRVPDIMKRTWEKKPRTGVRNTFSDV